MSTNKRANLVYMPNELLLTFTSGGPTPTVNDKRVLLLLERASRLAGGGGLVLKDHGNPPVLVPVRGGSVDPTVAHSQVPQPGDRTTLVQPAAVDIDRLPAGAASRDGGLLPQPPLTLRLALADPMPTADGRDPIRAAIDRINGALASLRVEEIALSSAMPNWVLSNASSGSGVPHGGPGTLPEAAEVGDWPITVPEAGAWPPPSMSAPLSAIGPHEQVVVAVLDSLPRLSAENVARNPLVKAMLGLDPAAPPILSEWQFTEPPVDLAPGQSSADMDHGIFVASVIHRIAPHAHIRLIQTLNAQGFGRTDLLLGALDSCLALAQSGQRVVVNLSLYLLIPPEDEIWFDWFAPDPPPAAGAAAKALEPLVSAVETRILLLLDAGAVVVAAAGNDAFTYGYAPQPRIPADYEDVLCVAATDREGGRAGYSNHADIPLTGNCVATWGGQGVELNGQTVVPPGPEPRDGMVGAAVEPTIVTPYGTVPNTTGWVYWSGTSFATPIISAIAANLLAENEFQLRQGLTHHRLTPRGVMARVLAMSGAAPDPAADPGAPYLKVSQQRY